MPLENVADASTTALTAFTTSACSIVAYNWVARTVISRDDKVTMEMYRSLLCAVPVQFQCLSSGLLQLAQQPPVLKTSSSP